MCSVPLPLPRSHLLSSRICLRQTCCNAAQVGAAVPCCALCILRFSFRSTSVGKQRCISARVHTWVCQWTHAALLGALATEIQTPPENTDNSPSSSRTICPLESSDIQGQLFLMTPDWSLIGKATDPLSSPWIHHLEWLVHCSSTVYYCSVEAGSQITKVTFS